MGLKIFGKAATPSLVLTAALTALVNNETVTAEQVDAANHDLDAAGIKGAQLVPSATLDELTAAADRTEAAEQANKATTDALAAAGVDSVSALVADRDKHKAESERLAALPGAPHTSPHRAGGKPDVQEEGGEAEAQKTVDALHAKMLAG